jgi:sugar phosphate isomerase/epimerase
MFLSLSSWIFGGLGAREMLAKVARCGYRHVEISAHHWPEKWDWRELCSVAGELGIKILSAHCCHHEIPDKDLDDKRYREYHERFYANLEGAKGVIIVEHESSKFEEPREIVRAELLRDLAKKQVLSVSFENMAAPPEKLEKLVRMEGLSFTFDPMHAVQLARLDPLRYAGLFDRLVNVHAMDEIKGASLGHAVPCGQGQIGWPGIIRALARASYRGPVTVEMEMSPVRRVAEMCKAVYETAYGVSSAPRFEPEIEEAFAVYARKYLENLIQQSHA